MEYVTWGIACVYFVLMLLFLRKPESDQEHGRVWNKTLLAVLYFLHAVFALFVARRLDEPSLLAVLAGLAFCMAGDILIQFRFVPGAILFLIANLVFFSFQIWNLNSLDLSFRTLWWFLPATAALLALVIWLEKSGWLHFGKLLHAGLLYLASVTLNGTLALLIALSGHASTGWILFCVGIALFMVSDYFLIYREFHKQSYLAGACNTITYFGGMMLISLSVLLL